MVIFKVLIISNWYLFCQTIPLVASLKEYLTKTAKALFLFYPPSGLELDNLPEALFHCPCNLFYILFCMSIGDCMESKVVPLHKDTAIEENLLELKVFFFVSRNYTPVVGNFMVREVDMESSTYRMEAGF